MLAYVFWHRPRRGVDLGSYETALSVFCRALEAASPPGLVSASTASLDRAPFTWPPATSPHGQGEPAGTPVYEDWYSIDDSAALDVIEAAAVGPECAAAHAAVASLASDGTGGVYRLAESGPTKGAAQIHGHWTSATWVELPAGTGRRQWTTQLTEREGGGAWWTRTLVLGPAPEFCLEGAWPQLPGALVVSRRLL